MHPQERDLIAGVFDRLAASSGTPKDAEADALIRERARALPDPVYTLVQAVCLQEVALRQAQARIAELERQAPPRPAGAGFLGGAPANPWGASPIPSVPPQPQYQQPQYQQPQYPQPQPPQYAPQPQSAPWGMGGGGFLRGVAGTAMGVAGGTLLAEGISSLFSGHHSGFGGGFGGGGFGGGAFGAEPQRVVENVTVNNYYGDQTADDSSDSSADANWQDDGSTDTDSGDDSVDM
ncbi:MAG TPA: DUF2076 domain-containing protein [Magnetospirillum sp.]|jgi:hypothetical protein|nr:DUF2076 domain-containing protein [Magnetospirillum sp.]